MHHRHVLPDGRALHYDWRPHAGPAAGGPPVAFLNGLSQTTVAWGLQAQRLRTHRGVLLHDAAGQGKSDPPPEGHRPPGHARDLVHLLDALGIEQVDAVGFSFGSRIALRLALQAPQRVRRLVLVGCAHRDTVVRAWIVRSWLDALEKGGLELAFRVVTPVIVGNAWLERNAGSEAEMLRAFTRRNTPEGMRRLLADTLLPGGGLTPADLAHVRHPTLVIRGEEDLVVSDAISRELAAAIPGALHVTCPGVGHTVAIEAPDWFAARLSSFL
jgi:pimeloyl-ACP methyl ester carboxylesterase